ncbi:response regulator transcription factor [Gottfriedia solisilvae]|uniref:response regulator transcription factor n=1 Tax=Gottfriedia solisilvae TaxID=1516104 RepID=UPI003D2EB74A
MVTTDEINYIHINQNTIIFVEHAVFLAGIMSILENHGQKISRVKIENYTNREANSLYIAQVRNDEMKEKASSLLKKDNTTRILFLKESFKIEEIEELIDLGVKGILLTELDEIQLIDAVIQLQKGNIYIDHVYMNELIYRERELVRSSNNSFVLKEILTNKEFEAFLLLSEGLSNIEISKRMGISDKTVKNHISNILDKLEVKDRLAAVVKALKNNWIKIGA